MTDYTVRDLMDKALEGLRPPNEDITDVVLAKATRRQHRRRATALAGTSAGLALVAGLAVLLPHQAQGAAGVGAAAGATARPGPTSTTQAATPPRPAQDAAALVASLLPPGIGTVTKIKDLAPTPLPPGMKKPKNFATSPLDGTYVITKDGRAAALIISSYDPKAVPAQSPFGPFDAGACHDDPASWNCAVTTLPGGATLVEETEPPGAWGAHAGTVNTAGLSYPSRWTISVIAVGGTKGLRPGQTFGAPWGPPPLTRAQLAAFVESPAWTQVR
ncbi:hypothetical protein [Streptacidiphilus jiangxiensis]|uniref:Uncharacterized protein n=1 Tax=Streptacidiphilus jiangxiensis TaxID=235985 RepID=A0A1H7HQD0_STRJI|nr:hypothetical protein [Streptacidiphilus jiangxiensis]SEK52583.1 hypothetical protein SAMN05414137_102313 [Streptacidiphilus jiangxiensis]